MALSEILSKDIWPGVAYTSECGKISNRLYSRSMYVFANVKAMENGADFTVQVPFTQIYDKTVRNYGIWNVAIACLSPGGEDYFESRPQPQKQLRRVDGESGVSDAWYEYHAIRLETHKALARYFS